MNVSQLRLRSEKFDDDDDDDNNNTNNNNNNHEVKELQKTAILGTAHILRKVLMYRYNGVNAGTSDIRTMNSYIRIVGNTMFPRDMVCFRNISVDILHKGDTEDINNNSNNKGVWLS